MTEFEKMKSGLWYDANYDEKLKELRSNCKDLCFRLNQTLPSSPNNKVLLTKLLGSIPNGLEINLPFTCDYGFNIQLGENVFINHSCYFMDGANISVGNNVFIGPYCGLYTANHPLDMAKRNQGLEQALPITIEDDCWIGANVSILPGVTVHKGSVIAAGSVVTHDIPPFTLVAGVPASIIKQL